MKQQAIKKRLLIETGIALVVLAVFAGGTWYLDSLSDDYEKENTALSSDVSSIGGQTSNLQAKYANAEKYSALYHEAMEKNNSNGLSISREVIKDLFDKFKERYHLLNLRLSMAPVQPVNDPKYKRDSRIIESSELGVTFDAASDENVYGFLTALNSEMPGAVKVTQLSLSRTGLPTDTILLQMSKQGAQPLVKADIHIVWFGMKTITPDEKTNAPGKS